MAGLDKLDLGFESIIPWNGHEDTGKDVRLKLDRNWKRIADAFQLVVDFLNDIGKVDIDELAKTFLRKDQADSATALITFLKGLAIGQNGSGIEVLEDGSSHAIIDSLSVKLKGFFKELESDKITALKELLVGSSGHGISVREDGSTQAVVDRLYVNMKAYFDALEVKKKTHVGGALIISPSGIKCTKVEVLETVFRCYFKAEEDGVTTDNTFTVGALAICQECNIRIGVAQHAGNRFYWRKVVEVGKDYIDLSKDIAAPDSNVPEVGDDIVALGHTDDITRQSAIVLASMDATSPSIIFYQAINSFSLDGKAVISLDFDHSTGHARMKCYGELYIGDKAGKTYLSFDDVNGLVIRASQIMLESGVSISDSITNLMTAVSEVSSQLDGSIEIWQGDFSTTDDTLQTDAVEPSKEWTSDTQRNEHIGDYLVLENGVCYEYSYDEENVRYEWKIVTDKYLLAYLNTLDTKKVIFRISDESTPSAFFAGKTYAQGDLWVNATYPEDGSTYADEELVCITPKTADAAFDITHWQPANGTTKKLLNAGIDIKNGNIAFTAEQFKFKNLLGELFAVLEEIDGVPTIRAELLNITGALIADKILASGLNIADKFVVNVDGDDVKVDVDGEITCDKLYYKNASVNVLDGSIITEAGSYTLPVIPENDSVEFRVFVPVPSRVYITIELICSDTDRIVTNAQNNNQFSWEYATSIQLESNYYYRVMGIHLGDGGCWFIEQSTGLL